MVSERQQGVSGRRSDVGQPFGRHAVAEQLVIGDVCEDWGRRREACFGLGPTKVGPYGRLLHVNRYDDLLHRLADLDQLRGARGWMGLQLAPFRPVVRLIVMGDEAKQQAGIAAMHDQADVAAGPYRPEALVLRLIEPVEAQAGIRRIELQIERRRLHSLLLVAGQASQAIREGVGDPEFHDQVRSITSS
jgi:hypothetical protein